MPKRLPALAQLGCLLTGRLPPSPSWPAILDVANRALVTPQLEAALDDAGLGNAPPPAVADFMRLAGRLNRERNRRLGVTLADALRALNDAGVTPTLLKGLALQATLPRQGLAMARMLGDLDLLVAPEEVATACRALTAAGFPMLSRYDGDDVHVVAEFGRADDVGCIDLHQRLPGPALLAAAVSASATFAEIAVGEGVARLPDPTSQAAALVLHDQLHDGGYWRGGFDVRHLLDIKLLAASGEGIDWSRLRSSFATALSRTMLETELIAAEQLMNAEPPAAFTSGRWSRLQYRRQLAQHTWPPARPLLAAAAAVSEASALAAHRAAIRTAGSQPAVGETSLQGVWTRMGRMQQILSARAGKL
jgi:hypothetical protein